MSLPSSLRSASLPSSFLYKVIDQCNPEYNPQLVKKMQLLYKGGPEIIQKAELFMPQELQEGGTAWQARLNCASYYNHFGQIVNDYTSTLFSKSLHLSPAVDAEDESTLGENTDDLADDFYRQFALDADLQDNCLSEILRNVLIEAMTSGYAYLGVDFPKVGEILPQNLAEEEEIGANRAYTYCIPTLSMIDWEKDDYGQYQYVVLKSEIIKRTDLTQSRDKKIIQFKVWQKEDDVISYAVYQIECKLHQQPKPNDLVKQVDSGTVSFKEIPILCLELPESLFIGGLIGPLCADHYKRYTSLIHSENRSLFAFPVFFQGPEIPEVGGALTAAQENPNRGNSLLNQFRNKGWVVAGGGDKIEFKEPLGTAYQIANQQLKELVESIHQIVNQMSNNILQTQGVKSGTSKMMDGQAKEIVLAAYGSLIKKFAIKLYRLISEARNENIIWQAKGMESYKLNDKEIILQEIAINNQIKQACPSKTLWKAQSQKLAFQLNDGLEPNDKDTIEDEIAEYFDSIQLDSVMNPDAATVSPTEKPAANTLRYGYGAANQDPKNGLQPKVPAAQPQKVLGSSSNNAENQSDDAPKNVGDTGHQVLGNQGHLQSGQHIPAQIVMDSIKDDYNPEDYAWMKLVPWSGPYEVDASSIDLSQMDQWRAQQPGQDGLDKVDEMAEKLADQGWWKPVVLVNSPHNNEKMQLIDGRHRVSAAIKNGMPILAYIGQVSEITPDMPYMQMHQLQKNTKS